MDDLLREFLTETNENLALLDSELVRLEKQPDDPELLGSIFRIAHTVKGTCGFLGLPRLEHVAHAAENILGKFRDGELPVTEEAVTLILRSLDAIKHIVGELERFEREPTGDDEALIGCLNAMADSASCPLPLEDPQEIFAGETSVNGSLPTEPSPDEVFTALALERNTRSSAAPSAPVVKVHEEVEAPEKSIAAQTIRVNLDQLESLMTTVSELVLTRNQLLQILRAQKDSPFAPPLQQLNLITSELQEGVMKTRMQPIGNAWAKLTRLVRDLSCDLGKKIDLQMQGAETELDRQVLELIKDPLTHMVRNSADHGIEAPEARLIAGKAETGVIALNAYHKGGHIVIEIADDGKGLGVERIREKALQNGLVSEGDLASMSDAQIMQFIFKPGFSTAAEVTAVSGRGVGMDVVKTNIERIGGAIDVSSVAGRGTRFLIKIPLTLAIVSALIVECAGERFAVPQINVVELVQAQAGGEHRVERINNTPVLRLRDHLLPLIPLRQILQLSDAGEEGGPACVVVTQVGNAAIGLLVDRVFDTEEIVVKPVSPMLRHISLYSGNTILGDGSVIMILDPNGVAVNGGEIGAEGEKLAEGPLAIERSTDKQLLLLFRAGSGAPKTVPLALVARLEEIDLSAVEFSSGAPVIQYRGKLMPLMVIEGEGILPKTGRRPVLVFSDSGRTMGLVVDDIIDIIEDTLHLDLSAASKGYLGGAIIAGKAMDVVDASYYLTQAFEDWFGSKAQQNAFQSDAMRRVLLVDDSAFFRNLLAPILKIADYEVMAVESAQHALRLQEQGEDFDVIISDIEMPGMNGFDFVNAVRQGGKWRNRPILALSSHATEKDLSRGREAGFTEHLAKFNSETLLQSLRRNLANSGSAA